MQKSEAKARNKGKKVDIGDIEPSEDFQDISPPLDDFKKKSTTAENKRIKKANGATGLPKTKKKKLEWESDTDDEDTILVLDESSEDEILLA